MFARLRFAHDLRRLGKAEEPVLARYAAAEWPEAGTPVRDAPLLALDFELDGLKRGAHLLQAGWTRFTPRAIPLEHAQVHDIRSNAALDRQAVTIHGIGGQRASEGARLREVIAALIADLAGRVLVAHGASIEVEALQGAAKALYGARLPIRSICTLMLERHLAPNLAGDGAYRLGAARARYGLPAYDAHDALGDAIAAAELLMAQLTRMPRDTTLGRLEALG
ncbi:exonuclease domain-containing protein [Erythrobacter sp. EC-HK427]|uniref:exonuclease domain-containing protein n=1 Tax=Erythrobacter sp. EC-HK427 TaxID=2038396 RepID=UPI001255E4D3|nr:exonuclease domain-containing protein [Erythrobacter sp. EC-HK427]VVT20956.1 DNA polymerase III subunit epsilon [Erythrobacter sp. EC-HK427]